MRNINIETFKRWIKMVTGKSIYHVNQDVGKNYSKDSIKGYYNDLTEKVLKDEATILGEIPVFTINCERIEFPIAVFQYGLGSYDLYLETGDEKYLSAFNVCCEWAVKTQVGDGSWNNFYYIYPNNPHSAMAQGEGASLLCRAYHNSKDEKFLIAASKALIFMIKDIKEGGTANYSDEDVYLLEYTHKPVVLNGWIFSIFGLYDYLLINDDENLSKVLSKTLRTLRKTILEFDNGYWSKYNMSNMLTSPFYHDLHIAQLRVLYDLTGINEFQSTANKWDEYRHKRINRSKAFVIKVIQKLKE